MSEYNPATAPGGVTWIALGGQRYRVTGSIPTSSNTTLLCAYSSDGQAVVIKRAATNNSLGSGIGELRLQIQQLLVLRRQISYAHYYPEVLYHDQQTLVLPFYQSGSLRDLMLTDVGDVFYVCLERATDVLFEIAWGGANQGRRSPDPALFLMHYGHARYQRLLDTADSALPGRSLRKAIATEHLELLDRYISDGTLRRASATLAAPRLGLCGHGDFVPANILVSEQEEPQPVFCDVRGCVIWKDDLPWWDPIMDFASLIFSVEIEHSLRRFSAPLLAENDEQPGPIARDALLERLLRLPALGRWIASDQHWRERLEVYLAFRFLGNVSVQLTYAPTHQFQRALAVYQLFTAQFAACLPLLQTFAPSTG